MPASTAVVEDLVPSNVILVEDIAVAAFLMQNRIVMASAAPGRSRRWKIYFKNPNPEDLEAGETVVRHLMARFPGSDIARFNARIEDIRRSASRFQGDLGKPGSRPDGRYQVGDVGMAAYICLCGEEDGEHEPTIQLSEVLQRGPAWAIRFANPNPENPEAGQAVLHHLRMHYANTKFAAHDGQVRAIKKAAFGD
jgi:hypothetical protein